MFQHGTYKGYRQRVRLVRCRVRYERVTLEGPDAVYRFMRDLRDEDRERFYTIGLDTRRRVVGCEEVSVGTVDASLVHPREVLKGLLLSNSAACIVAHNHPSGDPSPSPEDLSLTKRLYDAGKLLDIPVLDHIIIGTEGRYYSWQENGARSA